MKGNRLLSNVVHEMEGGEGGTGERRGGQHSESEPRVGRYITREHMALTNLFILLLFRNAR
jgi:hypothetical protein